jgi:hypothetical protein
MNPIFALIFPLGESTPGLTPGYPLPTPPGHPGNALPPIHARPTPPIYIPPGAIGPGWPSEPILLPGNDLPHVPGHPDHGLPGGGYPSHGLPSAPGRPTPPIVYPPGHPENGLPATPGVPPIHVSPPINFPPASGTLPIRPIPPNLGGGGTLPSDGQLVDLPVGSVLLIPVPERAQPKGDAPLPPDAPKPPAGVAPGSKPYLAWGGRGTLPIVVWIAPSATPNP